MHEYVCTSHIHSKTAVLLVFGQGGMWPVHRLAICQSDTHDTEKQASFLSSSSQSWARLIDPATTCVVVVVVIITIATTRTLMSRVRTRRLGAAAAKTIDRLHLFA